VLGNNRSGIGFETLGRCRRPPVGWITRLLQPASPGTSLPATHPIHETKRLANLASGGDPLDCLEVVAAAGRSRVVRSFSPRSRRWRVLNRERTKKAVLGSLEHRAAPHVAEVVDPATIEDSFEWVAVLRRALDLPAPPATGCAIGRRRAGQ
jgi:hypothetical protein